jgi:hypothetical protein
MRLGPWFATIALVICLQNSKHFCHVHVFTWSFQSKIEIADCRNFDDHCLSSTFAFNLNFFWHSRLQIFRRSKSINDLLQKVHIQKPAEAGRLRTVRSELGIEYDPSSKWNPPDVHAGLIFPVHVKSSWWNGLIYTYTWPSNVWHDISKQYATAPNWRSRSPQSISKSTVERFRQFEKHSGQSDSTKQGIKIDFSEIAAPYQQGIHKMPNLSSQWLSGFGSLWSILHREEWRSQVVVVKLVEKVGCDIWPLKVAEACLDWLTQIVKTRLQMHRAGDIFGMAGKIRLWTFVPVSISFQLSFYREPGSISSLSHCDSHRESQEAKSQIPPGDSPGESRVFLR